MDVLTELMKRELKGAMFEVEDLANIVFPDAELPFPIMDTLLDAIQFKVPKRRKEALLAKWLNNITEALAKQTKLAALRKWDTSLKNNFTKGSNIDCKPDIILLDANYTAPSGNKPSWKVVHAYAEVTTQQTQYRLTNTTYQKSFAVFETQLSRKFILSLTFNYRFVTFYACDLAGVVHTKSLPINGCKKVLLRLVAGFAFGEEYLLGYDPMMKCRDDEIITISVNGEEYTIVEKLFSSFAMRGCVTQCWHVRKGDQHFFLKDSWIDTNQQLSEIMVICL